MQLIFHEIKKDFQATFDLYKNLVTENPDFTFRMFEWMQNAMDNKHDRSKMLELIRNNLYYLV